MGEGQIIQRSQDPKRLFGLGAAAPTTGVGAADADAVIAAISALQRCPMWNMPTIETVRWNMQGPIATANINQNFGAKIDLFGAGESVNGVSFVQTTMAAPGQIQTYELVMGVGFHVEPEPLCFSILGNAFTTPTTGTAMPVSPDDFTGADVTNTQVTSSLVPAVLEWGWWANYASWHLVRAYNLKWQVGRHTTIFDDGLRFTAYCPPSAELGSASSSEVDTWNFARRVNTYYESLSPATTLTFLPFDRIRVGAVNNGAAGESAAKPSRAYERANATYGGIGLRAMLRGNREWRELALPYLIKPGVPIGLVLQQSDSVEAGLMQNYLDVQQGFGGTTPPTFQVEKNINSGNGATTMAEQSLDSPAVLNSPATLAQRALFKGGCLMWTLGVKGYEVQEDWAAWMSNPAIKDAISRGTGLQGVL